jgi:hypothetical protein
MVFLKGNKWAHDTRLTIKSCASVIIIGMFAITALLVIRLVGEQTLQNFMNISFRFMRQKKAEKVSAKRFVPEKQS